MSNRHFLGKKGELIARGHLMRAGYRILETGWRHGRYEVDLVTMKDDTLVFVEVKTRSSATGELADLQLSARQRRRIFEAGMSYLETHPLTDFWRFDLIAIEWFGAGNYRIRHLQDLDFSV